MAALNADDGSVIWVEDVGASPSAPLSFSHGRLPDVASGLTMATPEPMVVVPTTDGRYVSFGAPVGRIDFTGSREIWTITGQRNGAIPAMTFGGTNSPFHNYMYGSDTSGFLYAFSWDPTLPDDGQGITPGQPPIGPGEGPSDPTSINLGDIVRNARVDFILPQDFSNLQARASAGTLTQADLAAAINKVTRRHFEFGETAYLLVHNLPDPASFAPPFQYTVDLFFNAPGQKLAARRVWPDSGIRRCHAGQQPLRIGEFLVYWHWSKRSRSWHINNHCTWPFRHSTERESNDPGYEFPT